MNTTMERAFRYRFDRKICELLTCADDGTVTDSIKKRLNAMKKNSKIVENISYYTVTCIVSTKCKQEHVGRMFAKGDCLSYFPKYIRNAMCYKYYWDIDFVNSHPNICLQYAQKEKLNCEKLQEYCKNRDTILGELCEKYNYSREDMKMFILKLMYGGFYEQKESSIHKDTFLVELNKEVERIGLYIYDQNPDYADIKPKDSIKKLSKCEKKYARAAAYYCQTKERECLCAFMEYLESIKRPLCLQMYDGGYIEKIDGEKCCPESILRDGEKYILEKTGYDIKLVEKTIVNEFDFNEAEEYELLYEGYGIKDFDKEHIRVHDKFYKLFEDGNLIPITDITYFEQYNKKDIKGFKKILYKNSKKVYDKFDFIPYGLLPCPSNVYNTFKGFKFQELFSEQIYNFDSYKEYLDCLLEKYWNEETELIWNNSKTKWQITERLCDKRQDSIDYLLNYMAHIIVTPTKKIKKMIILTNTTGGIGKSTLVKMHFCDKLIGNSYWTAPQSLDEVFGNRNAVLEDKFVLFLDEVDVGVTGKIDGAIKDFVDREYTNIRKMCTDPIQKKCYCNSFLSTNKKFGVKFEPLNMRRFAVIEGVNGVEYRLTPTEKTLLAKETEDPNFNRIFLLALLKHYNQKFNFDELPRSELIIESTANAKSDIQQFTEWLFIDMNNYVIEKYVSKYNLPRKQYQWWPVETERKQIYEEQITQIPFRLHFQQIYDMFKYFMMENLPKFEVKSANQFKNNIEWKDFKKTYEVEVNTHNMYTCDYMQVRNYLKRPETLKQFERALKKQKTLE